MPISEKAAQRIKECRDNKLPYLNLSNCGLRNIPHQIFDFNWVKSLNLGNSEANDNSTNSDSLSNIYTVLYSKPLPNLRILIMNNCGLKDISFVSNFLFLKELYLSNNEISDIRALNKIVNNEKLKILHLGRNPIVDITPLKNESFINNTSITSYNHNLLELNLEKTNINDLSPLEYFANLEILNLNTNINQLHAYNFKEFRNLKELRISARELINFEHFGGFNLITLETLSLVFEKGDNSFVNNLINLTNLTLQSGYINDLVGFEALVNLRELNLSNNLITDITPLAKFKNLESLNLENNQIIDIKPIINLKQLNFLNLSNNKINALQPFLMLERRVIISEKLLLLNEELKNNPIEFQSNSSDFTLKINDNPIEDFPLNRLPTIQFLQDIKNYFAEDDKLRTIKHQETKVILVGNSVAGKTSLLNILRGDNFNQKENTTHGIHVIREKIGDIFINFWDFGGQEYYHGTHKLFFSPNAMYILLWNKETNGYDEITPTQITRDNKTISEYIEHFHYNYWLDNIRAFSPKKDTGRNEILIVQTHIDLPDNGRQNIENETISKYKIAGDYYLSLKPAGTGIKRFENSLESFKEELFEKIAQNLDVQYKENKLMTPNEYQIWQWFNQLSETEIPDSNPLKIIFNSDKYFITIDEFKKICDENSVTLTRSQIKTCMSGLHDVGIVLFYRDDFNLSQNIYFTSHRVTKLMYEILSEKTRENDGIFLPKHIAKYLKNNRDIWQIMAKFGVVAPIDGENYFAPQYLPTKHKYEESDIFNIAMAGFGEETIAIKLPIFYYRNAMMQLISKYSAASQGRVFWKNGVLFNQERTRVFLRGDLVSKKKENNEAVIYIAVAINDSNALENSKYNKQLEILKEIFKSMNLNNSNNPLGFIDELKERLSVALDKKLNFIPLFDLKKQVESKQTMIYWNRHRQSIRGFKVFLEAIGINMNKPAVFISYSHEDIDDLRELVKHLSAIKRNKNIEIWDDGEIKPGTEWRQEIKDHLDDADVVVFLISANFSSSQFIYDNEFKVALNRIEENQAKKIIPVLIKKTTQIPELWEKQLVPKNKKRRLKAVSLWTNKDVAWTQIAEAIGKAFEQ